MIKKRLRIHMKLAAHCRHDDAQKRIQIEKKVVLIIPNLPDSYVYRF
jgi:hypothetical protein